MSDPIIIHAHLPEGYRCSTRCGLELNYDDYDKIDDERVNCPECKAGLFYDLSERTRGLEKLVVSLKDSIDELLRRLGGRSESTYDDESY